MNVQQPLGAEAKKMQKPPVYEIERVSKIYNRNNLIALKDVNLRIHQGEFVSVIGASGCGKSTLLKIMAG